MSMRMRASWWTVSAGLLSLVAATAVLATPPQATAQAEQLGDGIRLMQTKGDYPAAAAMFELASKGPNRTIAAQALLYLAEVYDRLGRGEAEKTLRELIAKYAEDQPQIVAEARSRLAALNRRSGTVPPGKQLGEVGWPRTFWPAGPPSPDGRTILGANLETHDLESFDFVTGLTRRIAKAPTLQAASMSPDGSLIACVVLTPPEGGRPAGTALDVMSPSGAGQRSIYQNPGGDTLLDRWTPDAKSVLVLLVPRGAPRATLALVPVAGGPITELMAFESGSPLIFSLSPDGRWVAFDLPAREGAGERNIFLLDVATKSARPLIDSPSNDLYPVWTPDGQRILFASDRTDGFGLWALDVADGRPVGDPYLLHREMGRWRPIGIRKDGTLYYHVQTGLVDVNVAPIDLAANTAGRPSPLARTSLGTNLFPGWSADSRLIAFTKRHGDVPSQPGWVSVIVHDLETGAEREIKPRFADTGSGLPGSSYPRWSPDGLSLMVGGCGGLCRVDVATGKAELLVSNQPRRGVGVPEWTPDGQRIVFATNRGLASFGMDTREEHEIYRTPTAIWNMLIAVSHDGRHVAFVEPASAERDSPLALRVLPLDGGEATTAFFAASPKHALELAGWTPDDRELLFVESGSSAGAGTGRELFRVAVMGGAPRSTGLIADLMRDTRVSPDGRYVAFTVGAPLVENRKIENFIPPARPPKR